MSKDIWMYFIFIHTLVRFNNAVIRNVSCSFLLHIRYEEQYLTKATVSSECRVEPESIKSNDSDILSWFSIVRNVISKCFIQFTCTSLDNWQKDGGKFFKLLQKEGDTQKERGFPQKRGKIQPWTKLWGVTKPLIHVVRWLQGTKRG